MLFQHKICWTHPAYFICLNNNFYSLFCVFDLNTFVSNVFFFSSSRSISDPITGPSGTSTVPFLATTSGMIISLSQYLEDDAVSPGSVKLANDATAILWARPTPDSNIPPHHNGIFASWHMS